jgi:hypothetical protein
MAATIMVPLLALAAETDEERHERIERLVEGLASPNKAPDKRGKNEFADSYDRQAQIKVREAWQALIKEGTAAFPELVAHSSDKRYCATVEGGAADYNVTVGTACRRIIAIQVNVDDRRLRAIDRWYPSVLERDIEGWWMRAKGKSLLQMQIDAAESALEQIKKHSVDKLTQRENAEATRKANVAILEELIAKLKTRSEPIIPDWMGTNIVITQPYFGK